MRSAGFYDTLFIRLRGSFETEPTLGEAVPSYEENVHLWGNVEDLKPGAKLAFGQRDSLADCRIVLRQEPDITTKDRLRDSGTDELYVIDGISYGDNETLIDAHRIPE